MQIWSFDFIGLFLIKLLDHLLPFCTQTWGICFTLCFLLRYAVTYGWCGYSWLPYYLPALYSGCSYTTGPHPALPPNLLLQVKVSLAYGFAIPNTASNFVFVYSIRTLSKAGRDSRGSLAYHTAAVLCWSYCTVSLITPVKLRTMSTRIRSKHCEMPAHTFQYLQEYTSNPWTSGSLFLTLFDQAQGELHLL